MERRRPGNVPSRFGAAHMVVALIGASLLVLGFLYALHGYPLNLNGAVLIIVGMCLFILLAIAIFGPR